MHEIPKAALHMPIAFCRIGGSFELIAVQGLEPDCNYLVDSSGNWLGGYIPELYQNYPFSLASSDNQQVLCIDTDSDLISDNEGYPFFFDDQPSSEIQEILKSLSKFTSNHLITKQMCKMLEQFELLEIWPISVKKEEREVAVSGLYRVAESKFNTLPAESLIKLRDKGALPLIFCHLLSMQNLALIAQWSKPFDSSSRVPEELSFNLPENGGNINFDGL